MSKGLLAFLLTLSYGAIFVAGYTVALQDAGFEAAPYYTGSFDECRAGDYAVRLVLHRNLVDLNAALVESGWVPQTGVVYGGFVVPGDPVEVHVTAPRSTRDQERIRVWGHELLHVACGAWHDGYVEAEH